MLVKRIALLAAAAGLAIAPIANAAATPLPARAAAPVTNANYQDGDRVGPMAVILVLIVAVLIGLAAVSNDEEPDSP